MMARLLSTVGVERPLCGRSGAAWQRFSSFQARAAAERGALGGMFRPCVCGLAEAHPRILSSTDDRIGVRRAMGEVSLARRRDQSLVQSYQKIRRRRALCAVGAARAVRREKSPELAGSGTLRRGGGGPTRTAAAMEKVSCRRARLRAARLGTGPRRPWSAAGPGAPSAPAGALGIRGSRSSTAHTGAVEILEKRVSRFSGSGSSRSRARAPRPGVSSR